MKRSWTALAVALMAIFAVSSCNNYGNTFQGNTGAVIISLSPPNINAGLGDLTFTVTGGGFVAKTVVQWNGQNLTTTFVNSASVTAVVPAADTAKAGTASVNTLNPHSGSQDNGLSNVIVFTVFPPPNLVPTVSAMTPSCAVAGSTSSITLTITGTNFLPASDPSGGSQVNWNVATQTTLPIVGSISSTQIQATVSVSLVAKPDTATVSVSNPPVPNSPSGGGGTSANRPTFTIQSTACPLLHSAATTAPAVAEETPAVSQDGRYVAYTAAQSDHAQIFLRDTCEGAAAGCQQRTILLSAAEDGAAANDDSRSPSMNSDGRFLAFSSAATNLITEAPAGRQIYLRDTCLGATVSCTPSTQLVSTDPNGAFVGTESILPSVSASGRFIAFLAVTPSHAASQARGQASAQASKSLNSGYRQVFVRDTCFGAANCTSSTTRISLQPGDASSTDEKPAGPAISGAAKHIALAGARTSTLFTRSVAVDDGVFLALTNKQQ
ncbi:MAG TPA: IPT/TIG domain-containing protein [Candidatus Acidoferrum sp.]|nr:IPT/TIG domain-containing protein [Candidatus Acidoferrum sp.]